MTSPLLVAAAYAIVGTAVVSVVLSIWGEPYKLLDIVIASTGAALLALIPTIGGPLSLLGMLGLLYWRCSSNLAAIAASVALARLAMVPVLMLLK